MSGLRVERPADGVALVVIARPARLNALDDELLLEALPRTFDQIAADPAVRAVVVTGEGEFFSAGADLDCGGFRQPTTEAAEEFVRRAHWTPVAIRSMPQPSIAAVRGPAVGAGLGLALACDIRFAGRTARFGAPFVQMALVPDFGVSYFLPRVVGTAVALDIALSGRLLDADEALRVNLVSRVCDDPVAEALRTAEELASKPPEAVRVIRGNMYRSMELGLEAEILGQEVTTQAQALHGPEFQEKYHEWRRKVLGERA